MPDDGIKHVSFVPSEQATTAVVVFASEKTTIAVASPSQHDKLQTSDEESKALEPPEAHQQRKTSIVTKLWKLVSRNTVLVVFYKLVFAVILMLLLNLDWKYCSSPSNEVADSCSITVMGETNKTASCGFHNYLYLQCDIDSYTHFGPT